MDSDVEDQRLTFPPQPVITPMTTVFRDQEALHKGLIESIPQGRGCNSKEVSRAILFLASDEASYMSGHGKHLPVV
jgi:NAD(P)-dependent dehydrogenase (short-subunit alcohol dehydrogenase family)